MTDEQPKKAGGLLASTLLGTQPHPAEKGIATLPPGKNWFWNRPTAEGLYYNGKIIHLDGYQFIGCRFDNCTLVVASTNFDLINCIIDTSTTIQYEAEPLKIIKLFNSRSPWFFENLPQFAPVRNPDGSVTIRGNQP